MTEEADATGPEETGVYDDAPHVDGMLWALIDDVNNSENGAVSLTVSVKGAIISGVAIGRDAWMAKVIAKHADHPSAAQLASHINKFTVAAVTADHADFEEWFLHMEDAKYIAGVGRVPASGGLFMRIRIPEVDSWSLSYFGDDD